jgi:hypothetical protein
MGLSKNPVTRYCPFKAKGRFLLSLIWWQMSLIQIRVNRTSGACVSFLPLAMREAGSHGQVAEFSAYYLKGAASIGFSRKNNTSPILWSCLAALLLDRFLFRMAEITIEQDLKIWKGSGAKYSNIWGFVF